MLGHSQIFKGSALLHSSLNFVFKAISTPVAFTSKHVY